MLKIEGHASKEGYTVCSLEHANLYDDSLEFTALSYRWDLRTDKIVVDGFTLPVTHNLAEALDGLRRRGVQRVWADAVCINQKDVDEKDRQIPLMSEVYRVARRTTAWLPDVPRDAQDPIKGMRKSESNSALEIQSSLDFFENPYLRRLWVFQELALGRDVHFIYGRHAIALATLAQVLEGQISPELRDNQGLQHLRDILSLRPRVRGGGTIGLTEALRLSRWTESSEERDRVFALSALVIQHVSVLVTPWLTSSRQGTFVLISEHRHTQILSRSFAS